MSTTKLTAKTFSPHKFNSNQSAIKLHDYNISIELSSVSETNMSEKSELENLSGLGTNNFPHETLSQEKKPEECTANVESISSDKKNKFPWQFSDNVKRDSFGFILRTEPLPLNIEKSKKTDNHENLNNLDLIKSKSDKKSEKGKGEERFEDFKKSDRDRGRERERDKHRERERSPHMYKRKYSRSPSPRRSRHRRSRSRSRTPRDPRLRRNAPNAGDRDRYRYRRYSSEKSPDKESDKSEMRNSSPRRDRSRSPPPGWRVAHNRSGPMDPRNPSVNMNNRQEYVQMVPPTFHATTTNPVPPPSTSPGGLVHGAEGNAFNRYQPNNAAPVSAPPPPPPQYNYPPAPGTAATETYPGYEVYYSGYPPPQAHPQPEYIPTRTNNWQRDVTPQQKVPSAPVPTEDAAKKEAIEKEVLQQKITLSKQREEYLKKGIILNRELELLKAQKKDLMGDKTRDCEKLLKENNKLQLEINSKIKAVDNVIDILTGIIGDTRPIIQLEEKVDAGKGSGRESSKEKEKSSSREKAEKKKAEKRAKESSGSPDPSSSDDSSSDSNSEYRKKLRKTKKKKRKKNDRNDDNLVPPGTEAANLSAVEGVKEEPKSLCNFIYYDPEMHWCQICDEFPRTAKEYLNHLHSKEHKEMTQEKKLNDMPWHDLNMHEEVPFYEGAPTKRIPIKGLQFLVSATAWFCKLCRMWIGDLHCASLHLKSKEHSANYSQFNEQNPHWETDWMADREKAYEKCAEQRRRQRDEELLQKQKQERMELMKKQEEELKQKFFSSLINTESTDTELIMPLTLPRSYDNSSLPSKENSDGKKEKEKKKKGKKEKKKKEKRMKEKKKKSKEKKSKRSSSSESQSSSESSSESSDSEEEKKYKKELLADLEGRSKSIRVSMRNKEKAEEEKSSLTIPITLPEKSKWEMDEMADNKTASTAENNKTVEVKEVAKPPDPADDKIIKEWMKTDIPQPEKELGKNLKEKLRSKEKQRDWSKNEEDKSSRYDKKRSYRDKRQESSSSRRDRSSWDRKKDYRSSRHRRSRSRSRTRSNSRERDRDRDREREREREREKVTPGIIPAPLYDLFKLPDKHVVLLPESNKPERFEDGGGHHENEDGESKFEKQAMEAAKKKKIQPVITLPKSKFGFIGRMPFAKKRSDSGKKDDESPKKDDGSELEAPPPPRITQPRPPSPKTAKPVLTNKTKVETAKEIVSKYQKAFQEKAEEVQPIDPVVMKVEMTNPPLPPSPPVLTMMPPSPPKIRESPKSPKKTKKSPYPLPKDFQDALSIIYPEEKPEDKTEGYQNHELLANALSYQAAPMGYGNQMMMAYSGMHMMAAMPQMTPGPPVAPPLPHMMNPNTIRMFNQTAPPPPASEPSRDTPSPIMPPPPENLFETSFGLGSSTGAGIPGLDEDKMETSPKMSDDDMALLGIDAEDLAAQQL